MNSSEKTLALNIFKEFLNQDLSILIEKHLSEYTNNNKDQYLIKLKYLFELINPKNKFYNNDLVQNILQNKITPYQFIYLKPWELLPLLWKDILEEQNKQDKIIMDKTPIYTTDQFTCSKCKNNKCKTYSLQTRSADEPTTIFVNCITCDNTWRMS